MRKYLLFGLATLLLCSQYLSYFVMRHWSESRRLPIVEWGVRMKVDTRIDDVSYQYDDSMQSVRLLWDDRAKLMTQCPAVAIAWNIKRYGSDEPSPVPMDEQEGVKIRDSQHLDTTFRKISNNYFRLIYPQVSCGDSEANHLAYDIEQVYKNMFETLEATP